MKVFDLACMATCCWGCPKPKYEPFITHIREHLMDMKCMLNWLTKKKDRRKKKKTNISSKTSLLGPLIMRPAAGRYFLFSSKCNHWSPGQNAPPSVLYSTGFPPACFWREQVQLRNLGSPVVCCIPAAPAAHWTAAAALTESWWRAWCGEV